MVDIIWGILSLAALGISLASLSGFLGRLWWVFDLFSHFRVQYFVLLTAFAAVFLAGGLYFSAGISGFFALLNLALILPIYWKPTPVLSEGNDPSNPPQNPAALVVDTGQKEMTPSPTSLSSGSRTLKILSANVLQRNREYARVQELIQAEEPDILLLIEINSTWVKELEPALAPYPNRLTPLREDNYGLGLFSKFPFLSVEPVEFGNVKVPSVLASLELDGQRLVLIGTHPPPPKRLRLARQRNAQLDDISRRVVSQPGPAIVMGDLNITSWSPHFRDLLRQGRLKDSRQGQGLQASWPVDRFPLLVPIDHILVTGGIVVHRRWRGPYTGSDHYPVLMEFSLCPICIGADRR